ncbi:MAG: UbiA family prenyltransferase [Candidatus Bathycorpusculaceae bacterium]
MRKVGGYLRLMRPINCLMMGFAVIVGAALVNPKVLGGLWQNFTYGFVTGFALTAASMAINDYYDREIDAINEPNRPIPRGLIQPKNALIFASALTIIGFISAFLTSILCFLIAILAWIIFVTYTTIGKRSGLPGNFLVSTCVSMPFIYGSVVAVNRVVSNVLIFVLMVFLSNTGREITKGIVDVQGDRMQNVKTLAAIYGEKKAAITAALFYLFAVVLSPIPWLLGKVSFWFLPFVAITDFGLLASALMLVKDFSRKNARRIKKTVLLWFLIGLLAFIAGAF